jgi:hypothetical protein
MRSRYLCLLAAALCLAFVPAVSLAAVEGYSAVLSGLAENPPNASPGAGIATVILDDVALTAQYHIAFSGLLAAEVAAHFHGPACLPTLNAPVVFPLPLGSPKDGVWALTAAQAADLKNGCIYVNVHTSAYPGGEIRGNLQRDDTVPTAVTTWGRVKVIYR